MIIASLVEIDRASCVMMPRHCRRERRGHLCDDVSTPTDFSKISMKAALTPSGGASYSLLHNHIGSLPADKGYLATTQGAKPRDPPQGPPGYRSWTFKDRPAFSLPLLERREERDGGGWADGDLGPTRARE